MKIVTDYLGEVEYTKEDIISFPDGIYGFPDSREYLLLGEMTTEFPFVWLQSTTEETLSFILTNPFLFVEKYDFNLDDDIIAKLKLEKVEDVQVFTTVIVKENIKESSINLKSPIVINRNEMIASQVVLAEDYPFKHFIFQKGTDEPC